MPKTYNTPKRSFVIKTRLTEEEHAEFMKMLKACDMSQAEFLRQAIDGVPIKPIVNVGCIDDKFLESVGRLTAEYGKIGSNLNQIARVLNEWRSPYPQLAAEVRAAASDLAALKFAVLEKVGEAVGNVQAYKL
jgi:hypothetical protein